MVLELQVGMVHPRACENTEQPEQEGQDQRGIGFNELRQLVQQLQQRLECVEASRKDCDDSYHGSNGEYSNDEDEETNPFDNNHLVFRKTFHHNHTRRNAHSNRPLI